MAVEFNCPSCGGTLRTGDGPAGRLVRCGGCLAVLRVPDAPPLDALDDATDPQGRTELLPVAHPAEVASPEPAEQRPPRPSRPDRSQIGDRGDDNEPPPARTRSFWVSVTLVAMFVGGCGCCGLAAVVLPEPTWHEHESERGGFRVDLPGDADPDMARRVKPQKDRKHDGVEGTNLWTRSENYIVAHRDLKDAKGNPRFPDAAFLETEVKAITSEGSVTLGRNEPATHQGFPARDFSYEFKNGGTVSGRVVLAGNRVYVLVAGGQFSELGNPNVHRFLRSFRITDKKILAMRPPGARDETDDPPDPPDDEE
ncbi:unnamed protein product [Gemmataceae bacterium]|nr:unnamed protein product [Gemmataceae bacterium]VTU02286.1 unnamed protein product [Gemmataceae bacterium]